MMRAWRKQTRIRPADFEDKSQQLAQFARRDFSYLSNIVMPRRFPNSHERRPLYTVPFVRDMARQMAYHYRRPCRREFIPLPGERPLTDTDRARINGLYRALAVDTHMKSLSRMAVHQQTVVGVVLPVPGPIGRMRVLVFAPYEVQCDPDLLESDSISQAKAFRFRVPVSTDYGQTTYGTLTLTPTEAYYDTGRGRVGVFRSDMRNPLPAATPYPVFVARIDETEKGDFFCSLPDDLLHAQIEISVALSDALFIGGESAAGQPVLKGAQEGQAEMIRRGPDVALGLEEGQEFLIVAPQSALQPYLSATDKALGATRMMSGLPDSPMKSAALTSLAKLMERLDGDAYREDLNSGYLYAEYGLYRAVRLLDEWNWGLPKSPAEALPRCEVLATWTEPEIPTDELHQQQALEGRIKLGLTCAAEELAQERNVPVEVAQELVIANKQRTQAAEEANSTAPAQGAQNA